MLVRPRKSLRKVLNYFFKSLLKPRVQAQATNLAPFAPPLKNFRELREVAEVWRLVTR